MVFFKYVNLNHIKMCAEEVDLATYFLYLGSQSVELDYHACMMWEHSLGKKIQLSQFQIMQIKVSSMLSQVCRV